jgi:putative ATPase
MEAPLAERIRPQQLEDYISQTHLIGPEGSLTQQIEKVSSHHFFGATRYRETTLIVAQIATPLFSY